MSNYKYVNPINKGYLQFKLTKKQHNKLFPKQKKKWYNKYEYYYKADHILLHEFTSTPSKIIVSLLLPFTILFYGIKNTKQVLIEFKRMLNEKKYGAFVSETIWDKNKCQKVMDVLKGNSI